MQTVNETTEEMKEKVKQAQADIDIMNEKLKGLKDEKDSIEEKFLTTKSDYVSYKADYTYQGSCGNYFLIVAFIAFVFFVYAGLSNTMQDFFIIPATAVFAASLIYKFINSRKFKKMTPVMNEKETEYNSVKEEYDSFMADYNMLLSNLEKKQYEWELFENDRIEARKEAWIAQQKLAAN